MRLSSGMTLVEVLVALGIAAVLTTATAGALMLIARLDQHARLSEDLELATRSWSAARTWSGAAAWSNEQAVSVRAEFRTVREGQSHEAINWNLWELRCDQWPTVRTRLWFREPQSRPPP